MRTRPSAIFVAWLCFPLVPAFAGYDPNGLRLPAGFHGSIYVTGAGFHEDERGLPAVAAMAFAPDGALYFARTANRLKEIYGRGDARIYRTPPGAAKVTTDNETQFLFGPPLEDPDELAVNRHGEVFVSTSHPAGYGSVYRLRSDGSGGLFAGKPVSSGKPLLGDPEGIAFDRTDNVYVVDNELGVIVKLDAKGHLLDPRWLTGIRRGRTLTVDSKDNLWIGSDGDQGAKSRSAGTAMKNRVTVRAMRYDAASDEPGIRLFSAATAWHGHCEATASPNRGAIGYCTLFPTESAESLRGASENLRQTRLAFDDESDYWLLRLFPNSA